MDNFPDLFWLENAPGQLRSLVAGVVRGAFEDVGWNLCLKRGGGLDQTQLPEEEKGQERSRQRERAGAPTRRQGWEACERC